MDDKRMVTALCEARELERKGVDLYAGLRASGCDGLAGDMFDKLFEAEKLHLDTVEAIMNRLGGGADLAAACAPQSDGGEDLTRLFQSLAKMAARPELNVCTEIVRTLAQAQDFELAATRFYEKRLGAAESEVERAFYQRMTDEEKSHYVLIDEMLDFFGGETELQP